MKASNISEDFLLAQRVAIGARLKALRESKGLTQDQLGELVGLAKSAISRIEAGKWNFGIDTLNAFCVALDVDVELVKN